VATTSSRFVPITLPACCSRWLVTLGDHYLITHDDHEFCGTELAGPKRRRRVSHCDGHHEMSDLGAAGEPVHRTVTAITANDIPSSWMIRFSKKREGTDEKPVAAFH
jgi:hypothetical protein